MQLLSGRNVAAHLVEQRRQLLGADAQARDRRERLALEDADAFVGEADEVVAEEREPVGRLDVLPQLGREPIGHGVSLHASG